VTDDTGGTPDPGKGGETPPNDAPNSTPETGGGESIEGLRSALKTERDQRKANDKQLREMEARLREFEDRDKTEVEKLTGRADAAERELEQFKQRDLARTIATDQGVPDMWDLLHGDEATMVAQAKRLAERTAGAQEEEGVPDLGGGARGRDGNATGGKTGSKGFSAQLRRGAGYRP